MTFGDALDPLKLGRKIARETWKDRFLQSADLIILDFDNGEEKTWDVDHIDILENDWMTVE